MQQNSIKYNTNTSFDLSQYTICFIPNTTNNYYVGVKKNDIWPKVIYTEMSKVSSLSGSITSDGSYLYTLNNPGFLYYGRQYTNIYINYNGSIISNSDVPLKYKIEAVDYIYSHAKNNDNIIEDRISVYYDLEGKNFKWINEFGTFYPENYNSP